MASLRLALKASIKEANLPETQVQLSVPDLDALNQRKQKRNRAPSSPTSKSEKSEVKRKRSMSEMSSDSTPVVKKTCRPKKAPKQAEEKTDVVEQEVEVESAYEASVQSETTEVVMNTLHDIETAIIKEEAQTGAEEGLKISTTKEEPLMIKEEEKEEPETPNVEEPLTAVQPEHTEEAEPTNEQQEAESSKDNTSDHSDTEIPESLLVDQSYRVSSRAAAAVAKSKISERRKYRSRSNTEDNADDAPKRKKRAYNISPRGRAAKKEVKVEEPAEVVPAVVPVAEWVQCDTCGKWRKLPLNVAADSLPEQWYCSMNEWDTERNTCDAEEEVVAEPAPEEQQPVKVDGRYGPRPRGYRRKKAVAIEEDAPVEMVEVPSGRRRRNEEEASEIAPSSTAPVVENVNWVQCNKCGKWRKVPNEIFLQGMPNVWYCAMNTWALAYARCAAKEESEEKSQAGAVAQDGRTGLGRGKYIRKNKHTSQSTNIIVNGVPVTKKVTEWVQCERKNCQKWRKVPPHIDLASLPAKWYCEMNTWDPERATCDGPEESDSDTEQPIAAGTRSQLIMGNSKGPGTLSYRRLIFGSDGRIRPAYSEKNKTGYGIFSHTEAHRPSNADEYVMPTRKVGYWWSSAYDEDGAIYTTSSRQRYNINGPTGPRKAVKDDEPLVRHIPKPQEKLHERAYLIEAALHMKPQYKDPLPPKKRHGARVQLTSLQRRLVQRSIVHSCLLTPHPTPNHVVTYNEIVKAVGSAYFAADPIKEACRLDMSVWEIKQALRALEEQNLIEATYNNDFELCFRLLGSPVGTITENKFAGVMRPQSEDNPDRNYPLKMRKSKLTIAHVSSSESSSSEETESEEEEDEENDEGSTVEATEKSFAENEEDDDNEEVNEGAEEANEDAEEAEGDDDVQNESIDASYFETERGDEEENDVDEEEIIHEVSHAVEEAVMSSNDSAEECAEDEQDETADDIA